MGIPRDTVIQVHPQQSRTEYVTKEVNINRQSTSDDARLLRELEAEAVSAVTNTIFHKLKPINIDCAEIHITDNHLKYNKLIYLIYNLNGRKLQRSVEWDDWIMLNKNERIEKMYKVIADEIAKMLITNGAQNGLFG